MPNILRANTSLVALIAFVAPCLHDAPFASDKIVIGWVEKVKLIDYGMTIEAKVDSGARHSSLNATDSSLSNRAGKKWITFSLTDREGKHMVIEAPVVRFAKIKNKGFKTQLRPVITMKLCIADQIKEVEVNIVDRSMFNYQMLVGRSFIAGHFLVDVSSKYQQEPKCGKY